MKTLFIVTLWKRVKELVVKLLSVKGSFAITATIIFFKDTTSQLAFAGFFLAWCIFIGAREMAKYKGIIPLPKVE